MVGLIVVSHAVVYTCLCLPWAHPCIQESSPEATYVIGDECVAVLPKVYPVFSSSCVWDIVDRKPPHITLSSVCISTVNVRALPLGLVTEGIEAQCFVIACVPSSVGNTEGLERICLAGEVAAEGVGDGVRILYNHPYESADGFVTANIDAAVIRWQDGAEGICKIAADRTPHGTHLWHIHKTNCLCKVSLCDKAL